MLKIIKYSAVVIGLLLTKPVICQTMAIVNGCIDRKEDQIKEITISSARLNPMTNIADVVAKIPIDQNNHFYYKLPLNEPSLLFVKYTGFDHEVYIEPFDSLFVAFKTMPVPDTIKTMHFTISNSEKVVFTGNNTHKFIFFELLEKETGSLSDLPVKLDLHATDFLLVYKRILDSLTQIRRHFLSDYILKYNLSDTFGKYAGYEIEGSFLMLLELTIFYRQQTNSDFPSGYFKELDEKRFSWDENKNSKFFSAAINLLVTDFMNNKPESTKEAKLEIIYQNIMTRLKGDSLRNYYLTSLLLHNIKKQPNNFKKILTQFKKDCTSKRDIENIINLYDKVTIRKP